MLDWNADMSAAPKDGTELMLFYSNFLGQPRMVVSGHWRCEVGREFEATWEHSLGFGDADMWAFMPDGPDLSPLAGTFVDYLPPIAPADTPLLSRLKG